MAISRGYHVCIVQIRKVLQLITAMLTKNKVRKLFIMAEEFCSFFIVR